MSLLRSLSGSTVNPAARSCSFLPSGWHEVRGRSHDPPRRGLLLACATCCLRHDVSYTTHRAHLPVVRSQSLANS